MAEIWRRCRGDAHLDGDVLAPARRVRRHHTTRRGDGNEDGGDGDATHPALEGGAGRPKPATRHEHLRAAVHARVWRRGGGGVRRGVGVVEGEGERARGKTSRDVRASAHHAQLDGGGGVRRMKGGSAADK